MVQRGAEKESRAGSKAWVVLGKRGHMSDGGMDTH